MALHDQDDGLNPDITLPETPPTPSTARPFLPTDSHSAQQRALLRLAVMGTTGKMKAKDFAVFDLAFMGGMTIADTARQLKIPATTARDRFQAACQLILREVLNNPRTRAALETALTDAGLSLESLLAPARPDEDALDN
jgi:hypothetical protein